MVQLHCSVSEDTLKSNYETNKDRNLPSISKLKNSPHKHSEEINICAAGPSIRQFEKFLRISKKRYLRVQNGQLPNLYWMRPSIQRVH
jgi:hypothetical protein